MPFPKAANWIAGGIRQRSLRRRIELLAGRFGKVPEAAGPFGWKLLLALMRRALTRELAPFGLKGTAPLVEDRIHRLLATGDDFRARLTDERMVYDFLVLFGRRLPLGIYHAEVGAVPRSRLVRSAPADAWRLARYLALEMRGFGPTLAIHLPKQMDRPLTERDYVEAHLLAVQLFESNPRLKGFFNAAWYYDPAIASISPHLAFLPRFASSHGAITLSIGQSEDVVADAAFEEQYAAPTLPSGRVFTPRTSPASGAGGDSWSGRTNIAMCEFSHRIGTPARIVRVGGTWGGVWERGGAVCASVEAGDRGAQGATKRVVSCEPGQRERSAVPGAHWLGRRRGRDLALRTRCAAPRGD